MHVLWESEDVSDSLAPPEEVRSKYGDLKRFGASVVDVTLEVVELADAYERCQNLSPNHRDDGLHIAAATVQSVDVLTSWNVQHIVHFEEIRQFDAVNQELGYKPIDIRSPREGTNDGPEEDV